MSTAWPRARWPAPASVCWWRSPLLPQVSRRTPASPRITSSHVFKGAELAGTVCAHPLRGRGYDHDTPLLLGDFVTTEAGTGFVHIAPGHGEDDFALGRAHGLEVPGHGGR